MAKWPKTTKVKTLDYEKDGKKLTGTTLGSVLPCGHEISSTKSGADYAQSVTRALRDLASTRDDHRKRCARFVGLSASEVRTFNAPPRKP